MSGGLGPRRHGASDRTGRRIRPARLDGYDATTDRWVALHGAVLAHFGLRVRAPFTLREVTVSVGAPVEGGALRPGTERDAGTIACPTGPGGGPEKWTLFDVGLDALASQIFELDPDRTGPAVRDG